MKMKNVHKPSTSMKNWSADDLPEEKAARHGLQILSNAELLSLLIRSGGKERPAILLAKEILDYCKNNLSQLAKLNHRDFLQIKGIGTKKALMIASAMELGRRRTGGNGIEKLRITSSKDVATFLQSQMSDLNYEVFAVVFLNRANKIIHFEIISRGGITGTVADPRVILKQALLHGATSLILSHNHPSGNLQPSKADDVVTRNIKDAAALVDIKLLDHLIVSEDGYYSYLDEGVL
jgi:DNA repair protein RadC